MQFPQDLSEEAVIRLRRAEGQVRGVIRLLEEGADCKEVVTQLSAAQAALHRAGLRMMASGMRHCFTNPEDAEATGMRAEDIEALFLNLR